jgi:hypothetical protein
LKRELIELIEGEGEEEGRKGGREKGGRREAQWL